MKSYFYINYNNYAKNKGVIKIGTTTRNVYTRLKELNKQEQLVNIGYFEFVDNKNGTFAIAVESHIRNILANIDGLTHYGNDHFSYNNQATLNNKTQVMVYIETIVNEVVRYCEFMNKGYELY